MANNRSAEKRNRQTVVRRDRNRAYRSRLRTAIKHLRSAIDAGDKSKAEELLSPTLALVDATAQKGVVHRNAAGRTKSRLTRAVAALEG